VCFSQPNDPAFSCVGPHCFRTDERAWPHVNCNAMFGHGASHLVLNSNVGHSLRGPGQRILIRFEEGRTGNESVRQPRA